MRNLMSFPKPRPGDWLILAIGSAAVAALFATLWHSEPAGKVRIRAGDAVFATLSLAQKRALDVPGPLGISRIEIDNGRAREVPRKHTINLMPAARVSVLITADAKGRWAFHCHLLYHMDMGMFRVVRVS